MSDSQSTSNDFPCPECGATVKVSLEETRGKAWCSACERDVLAPWSVAAPSTEFSGEGGYELAKGFDQPEAKVYIPVVCRVCGTRMYGTEDQVGQDIPCPDCFAENRVPPPSAEDRKRSTPENLGPDLEMGTGASRPTMEQIGLSHLFEEDSETTEQDASLSMKQPLVEEEVPEISKWFLVSRVFTFPFYPSVIAWWLGLSASWSLIYLAVLGVEILSSKGLLAGAAVFLTLIPATGGALMGAMLFSCCLNVLQISADGIDTLSDSEGIQWADRFLEAAYVMISLIYSIFPGWGIGQLLRLAGLPYELICVSVSVFLLFPVILLSTLESGSPVIPYSKPILRTIRYGWWVWLLFYLESAAMISIPHLAAKLSIGTIFDNPFFGPGLLVAQAIIYFRLLGRVAWYGSLLPVELGRQADALEETEGNIPSDEGPMADDEPVASDQSE